METNQAETSQQKVRKYKQKKPAKTLSEKLENPIIRKRLTIQQLKDEGKTPKVSP